MDRRIVYIDQNPLDVDQLEQSKNTMIAIGMLLKAIIGTSTLFDGLACTPTGPASLQVLVAPGSVYALQNVDGTAFGSIAADTTHQIVKQGISLDTLTLSCPAPGTTGQSINYLIQGIYQDTDTGATVLPYFNPDNPDVAFNGPDGTGTSQNTTREGQCIVAVKAGVAATTGSQTTPAPDAGYTGLWVVTVAHGQTTIVSGNIVQVTNAPFISEKLSDKVSIPTGDARWMPIGSGFAGIPSRTAIFKSSGTWTAPTGVTSILVDAAAGGGGGGGTNGTSNAGEGGGGGDAVKGALLTVVPGTTYTITVGAKGTGGAASANGTSGGTTSIGTLLSLTGGTGGNSSGVSGGQPGGPGGSFGNDDFGLYGGTGGGSIFGSGGASRAGGGLPAGGYGGGGGGGSVSSGAQPGGDGSPGFVLIQW